ncbi:MAG: hypothetical protein RSD04_05275 [Clostridia bacterium]
MKSSTKFFSIFLTTIFLATLFLTLAIFVLPRQSFAVESKQSYYIANSNINVYGAKEDNSPNEEIVFSIPRTYYFLSDSATSGDFTAITYNDNAFFVKTADFNSASVKQTVDIVSPYFSMSDMTVTPDKFKYFYNNSLAFEELDKSKLVSASFVGFNIIQNKTYFYSKIVYLFNGKNQTVFAYLAPADTNKSDMELSKVALHPNSQPKPDPTPDPDPDGKDPAITPPDDKITPSTNNLIRNILIGVIAVLSVVIVFLIFKPSRNSRNRYDHDHNDRRNDF